MNWEPVKAPLRRARSGVQTVIRKLRGTVFGHAPVSRSCQIPNLRQVLSNAGLKARSGVFVEIGAFDGETYSNTSFLADQGWRGLYVEPVPEHCARTRARHRLNKVDVLQAAIADEAGEMEMIVMGALTTSAHDVAGIYSETDWALNQWRQRKTCTVKTLPLKTALERMHIAKTFDLLVVDVEGNEEGIIDQLLRSEYRPKVVVIELTDKHASFSSCADLQLSHQRVRARMDADGYGTIYEDPINTVFCRQLGG